MIFYTNMVNKSLARLLLVAGLGILSQTAAAEDIADPLTGSLRFFAHVEAEDIRARCGDGQERFRAVYNAGYDRQVRSYTLSDGTLSVRTRGQANLLSLQITDPLKPWRGGREDRPLEAGEAAGLMRAVIDGMATAPPDGLRLPADRSWWIVAACRGGRFAFDAVLHPERRWRDLRFPEALAAADRTGLAWAAPQEEPMRGPGSLTDNAPAFVLTVGEDGLVPMPKLLR